MPDANTPEAQIRPLLSHEQTAIRLYGLLLLEAQLPHLAPTTIREAISSVEPGDEPAPRSVLARLREALTRAPDQAEAQLVTRSILEGPPFPPSFTSTLPAGLDPAPLPTEARELAERIVECLTDHLRRGVVSEPGRVWRALGQLRHPWTVGAIRGFFSRGRESQEMYRCLQAVRSREAEDLLIKAAGSANETTKPTLLEAMGELKERDPLLLLSQAVSSPRRAERVAAARALGHCRRRGTATLLTKLTADSDPDVACAALDSVALVKDPELVPVLGGLLPKLGDPAVRARLAAVVAVIGGPEARKLLASLVRDPAPEIASAAAHGLTAYPGWAGELGAELEPFMASSDPLMRAAGIVARYPHDAERAERTLLEMLASADPVARAEAAGCVRFIQSPAIVKEYVAAIAREPNLETLGGQTAVLGHLAPATPLSVLQPLFSHQRPEVRSAAAAFLVSHSDQQAGPLLSKMCQAESQPIVKRRVAQSLVHRCRRDSPDRLKDFLLDRDSRVIATAIEDMEELAGLEVVPFVGPLLTHTTNRVRANAIVTLFRMGRFDGLEHLLAMLDDPKSPAFASGLYAVGRIGKALTYESLRLSPALVSGLAERARRNTGSGTGKLTLDLSPVKMGAPTGQYPMGGLSTALSTSSLDITIMQTAQKAVQSPEAKLEAILTEILKGDLGGLAKLREHLTLYPHDQGARYLLLRVLLRLGDDPGDLVEGYARETVGAFANPYIDLARVAKEQGQGTRAMGFYIRSFESCLFALQRLVDTARQRLEAEDFLGTSRTLEVLGSLLPINPIIHASLGEHYLNLGENERAFEELHRAHLASPDHPVIALKLAAACVKTQRIDVATEVLSSLLVREDSSSAYRAKAQQILDSLQARARKKEEKRRQQAAELLEPPSEDEEENGE